MRRLHGAGSLSFVLLGLWLGACQCGEPVATGDGGSGGGGGAVGGGQGGGGVDAGDVDAGDVDAGDVDAGDVDAGDVDAGDVDAGDVDAGDVDAGEVDAGEVDGGSTDGGSQLVDGGTGPLTCWSCHGSPNQPAPPVDTHGVADRLARTVGAHREHVGTAYWHRTLVCEDCHHVPAIIEEPGHIDPSPAELTWGAVANAGNVSSSFNGQTCTTYCHGTTLAGGANTQPPWTSGPSPVLCNACHGFPPPPPHPRNSGYGCPACHLDVFAENEKHINGQLDVKLACDSCHGDATSPAPPRDTQGNTSTALRTVGAHRSHLGASSWHAEVACEDCHTVPTRYDDPGHIDPSPAELHWGSLASARGGSPSWNGTSCANYCHGQTIAGGTNKAPAWSQVNGTQAACGTCHSLPPAAPHPQNPNCSVCHSAVIDSTGAFVDPSLHINGTVEAQLSCGSCHPVPPATGTHLLHVGAQGTRAYGSLSTAASVSSPTGYAFGCGNCHPIDPANHMSGGRADIELYNPSAPPGSLKARSPLATYTPGATVFTGDAGIPYTLGSCGNVYCHSGPSYATPNPVPRPGVDFSFAGYPVSYPSFALDVGRTFQSVTWGSTGLGCAGCHGFPLRTSEPSVHAGAGQSHSMIGSTGLESGHAYAHNGAPLGCRTCHHDTVTAANSTGSVGGLTTYGPVPVTGWARHVNGLPDVAFDTVDPVAVRGVPQSLVQATYSQATATCSNVSCHKSQSAVKNGHPFRPDQVNIECNACHQY